MTTYNCAIYIEQAIRSILNQTFKDFEFWIIDDGSTDHSEQIVQSFSDARIKYDKISHSGRSKALNYGLIKSNSDLISIMDADDIAHPQRLEKQYEFLLKNSNIDIVGSWADLINERDEPIGILKKPLNERTIRRNLLSINGISFPTSLFRFKNLYYKQFNESLSFGEDLEWFYKNSFHCNYNNLPLKLMKLRQRQNSLSHSQNINYNKLVESLNSIINLELNKPSRNKSKTILIRDLGLIQYYYSSILKSFKYFSKVFFMNPFDMINIRYLISSLLILTFGKTIRQNKIFRALSNSFRNLFIK